jgi:hypothetical protein
MIRISARMQRCLVAALVLATALQARAAPTPETPTTETIVLLRHGEKPDAGLGQLDCQGLNRALALPTVLARSFATPRSIYAPDPAEQKPDDGRDYDYVRPLATIEPTAIALGLPVHAAFGVSRLDLLQQALEAPANHAAVVLVAWEHHGIVTLARALMTAHGAAAAVVPNWPATDFDSLFVVRLRWTGQTATATFGRRSEGLDGQAGSCPHPAQ